jgi:cytochrome c556
MTQREIAYRRLYKAHFAEPYDWRESAMKREDSRWHEEAGWVNGLDEFDAEAFREACDTLALREIREPVLWQLRSEYEEIVRREQQTVSTQPRRHCTPEEEAEMERMTANLLAGWRGQKQAKEETSHR